MSARGNTSNDADYDTSDGSSNTDTGSGSGGNGRTCTIGNTGPGSFKCEQSPGGWGGCE